MKITEIQLRRMIRRKLIIEQKQGSPSAVAGIGGGGLFSGGDKESSQAFDISNRPTGGGGGQVPGEDIRATDSAVILKMEPLSASPNVVYIIRGQGYGNQNYIKRKIQNEIGSQPNTIVAISTSEHVDFDDLSSEVQEYMDTLDELPDGATPGRERIVGWSLGASGLKKALRDPGPSRFDKVWYADPSPRYLLGSDHSNSLMYYRISNWGSWAADPMARLAEEVGENAMTIDNDHNEILVLSIREALAP